MLALMLLTGSVCGLPEVLAKSIQYNVALITTTENNLVSLSHMQETQLLA